MNENIVAKICVSVNQTLKEQIDSKYKEELEKIMDPFKDMTDAERVAYENKIKMKLKMGKRLMAQEMNYLKIYNPILYRTALRVKLAKDKLKEQLKHCRSKEEANDRIMQAMLQISHKDPDREYLLAGIRETANIFRKDNSYVRLPDTREEADKQKKNKTIECYFDDEQEDEKVFSPLIEIIETMPVFDVVQ